MRPTQRATILLTLAALSLYSSQAFAQYNPPSEPTSPSDTQQEGDTPQEEKEAEVVEAAPAVVADPTPPPVVVQTDEAVVEEVVEAAPSMPPQPTTTSPVNSSWNAKAKPGTPLWDLNLYGFIRAKYTYLQREEDFPTGGATIGGSNSGFTTAHARLGVSGKIYKVFGFKLLFDGATSLQITKNHQPLQTAAIRDAFLTYDPFPFIGIKAGQFIPNFDLEGSLSTSSRPFAELSLASRGLKIGEYKKDLSPPEKASVKGLSKGNREMGIAIGATDYRPLANSNSPIKDLGISYEFAVTNGDSASKPINTNQYYAYYARAAVNWAKLAKVGIGYYHNSTSETTNLQGISVDASGNAFGLSYTLSFIQQINNTDINQSDKIITSNALEASLQYTIDPFGITPGVQYAYLDPNADPKADKDHLQAVTFGVNWEYKDLPFKTVLNYTLNFEGEDTQISNNRFDVVFQLKF